MTQHLYPCECCGRHGVAHYRLVKDGEGYRNVLLCTACYAAGCDSEHDCLAYPAERPIDQIERQLERRKDPVGMFGRGR